MKATTTHEKKVEALAKKLPALTDRQKHEALLAEGSIYAGRKTHWCSCCNHEFEDATLWRSHRKKARCPHCGHTLRLVKSPQKSVDSMKYYFTVVTTRCGYQVTRNFFCYKTVQRERTRIDIGLYQKADTHFSIDEVSQLWLTPDGKTTVINARCASCNMHYNDIWDFSSQLSIKKARPNFSERFYYTGYCASRPRLLPEVKRNGLTRLDDEVNVFVLIKKVLTDPLAESIVKHKQTKLLRDYISNNYWYDWKTLVPTLRIALRHNYVIKDLRMFADYISDLQKLGKDLRNPHFVCPDNLRKAHAETTRRLEVLEERQRRAEEERKLIAEAEAVKRYAERMCDFAQIRLSDGNVVVTAIPTVDAVREEGHAMHHCVFANGYYKNDNSLLLTARINGKRIETVEFGLHQGHVLQSRGVSNSTTKYHSDIIALVESNAKRLQKAVQQH